VGKLPMAERLHNSWLALDDAIGIYKAALADVLACSPDTLDLWTSPPPAFTPQTARNRGRRNPLDELHAIASYCPNGLHAVRHLAEALGYRLIPKATTPAHGRLLASTATVAADADELLAELARRPSRRKLTADRLRDLRDRILDGIAALADAAINDREKQRG